MEENIDLTEQLRQEVQVLKEENLKLKNESERYQQIISIMEQMNGLSQPVVMNCKCDQNSDKIKTKLNVLKQKYDLLLNETNRDNNLINSDNNLVNKIINCGKITPKLIIKKNDIEEFGINENENNDNQQQEGVD